MTLKLSFFFFSLIIANIFRKIVFTISCFDFEKSYLSKKSCVKCLSMHKAQKDKLQLKQKKWAFSLGCKLHSNICLNFESVDKILSSKSVGTIFNFIVLNPDGSVWDIRDVSGSIISARRNLLKFVKSLSLYSILNFFWEFKFATSTIFFFNVPKVIFLSTSKFTSLNESVKKQFNFTFDDGS